MFELNIIICNGEKTEVIYSSQAIIRTKELKIIRNSTIEIFILLGLFYLCFKMYLNHFVFILNFL